MASEQQQWQQWQQQQQLGQPSAQLPAQSAAGAPPSQTAQGGFHASLPGTGAIAAANQQQWHPPGFGGPGGGGPGHGVGFGDAPNGAPSVQPHPTWGANKPPTSVQPTASTQQRETGVVLDWDSKGFGMIKPDVPGEGGDLYAHFTQITDGNQLEPGSKVEFVKTYNDFKGKWCAQTITGGKAGVAPVTDVMVLAPTIAPRPGSIAHRVQGPTPGEPVSLAGRNWLHLAKSQGIVVQWDKRGFGFVRPHHGGADLFIHFSEILDGNWLDPGAQVAFIREFHGLHGLYYARTLTGGYYKQLEEKPSGEDASAPETGANEAATTTTKATPAVPFATPKMLAPLRVPPAKPAVSVPKDDPVKPSPAAAAATNAAAATSAAPSGRRLGNTPWTEYTDKNTGHLYYVNSVTNQTQWTKPAELVNLDAMSRLEKTLSATGPV